MSEIPVLNVSDDFVNEMAKEDPKLRSGAWFQALVTRQTQGVSKDETKLTMYWRLFLACLKEEGDAESLCKAAKFSTMICVPKKHPALPPPADKAEALERKQWERTMTNMLVDKFTVLFSDEYDEDTMSKEDIRRKAVMDCYDFWDSKADNCFVDSACYVQLDTSGDYPEVTRMVSELPPGETLCPFEDWFEEEEEGVQEEASEDTEEDTEEDSTEKKKKVTKKKTSKKKVSKKKSK